MWFDEFSFSDFSVNIVGEHAGDYNHQDISKNTAI